MVEPHIFAELNVADDEQQETVWLSGKQRIASWYVYNTMRAGNDGAFVALRILEEKRSRGHRVGSEKGTVKEARQR